MKRDVVWTSQFKKDYKKLMKRHANIENLDNVIRKLAAGEELDDKNKDHNLAGNWNGYRECHIEPNWLLIYKIDDGLLILTLTRTGSHSDLFKINLIRTKPRWDHFGTTGVL